MTPVYESHGGSFFAQESSTCSSVLGVIFKKYPFSIIKWYQVELLLDYISDSNPYSGVQLRP